jgi:signal transduction histidine kinase
MAGEKVLIVDDEADVLTLCQRILVADGYRVKTVQTGYAALEEVKQQPFDLLLVDIKMPGINGLETAQAIKQLDPGIVCVTMTGYSTMDTAIEALKLGVDEFVIKPFAPEDLSISVAKALEKERLRKENIRLRSLIPLFEFNKTLLSTIEIESLLRHVLELAQSETKADLAILFLNETGEIRQYSLLPAPQSGDPARLLLLELANWIMQHQARVSLRRGEVIGGQFGALPEMLGVEYMTGIPLVAKEGRSLGTLVLGKHAAPFASGDSEFLQVMGGQAAIAIENAHLFQEIQRAYNELKKLDHMKSEFINIAAHELRTPLAILMGYASVMEEEASGQDQARLGVITRNAMRLRALIDDMLNLNYLETGQAHLRLEEVDLGQLIRDVVLDMRSSAEEKSLNVEVCVPADFPPMVTDREKLDLVVMNLLSNAIKFTPEEGHVWLKARVEGDNAVVMVRDSGIGIPAEERDKIFERFYQVGSSLTRQQGGTGLGLAIAKGMVELCRGRIWVESELGQGSTFTFEVPLRISTR